MQVIQVIQVKRVRNAVGAYCFDCNRVIGEPYQTFPWNWRKSQMLHERGTGHRTGMYRIDYDTSNPTPRAGRRVSSENYRAE